MKISKNGIELIKKYEGCSLTAYRCPAGKWTIGFGHTGNVGENDKITQQQAEAYLVADVSKYEKCVAKYEKYKWNQNEFDALVSFAYNIGSIDGLTEKGTRSKQEIAEKILLYNKAFGKVLTGLARRRKEERALFMTPCGEKVENKKSCGIVTYSLKADGENQISKNFRVKEFRCKDGSDKILIDVDFVREVLQAIREHFNVPVTINSAYRTETYNRKVGGAKQSYHVKGQAFDIVVKNKTPGEVARYAQQLGVKGIIQYNGFVHIDSRKTKYWARNNNGKVTVKSSF